MKGYFSLNIDLYSQAIFFGNLGKNSFDSEVFAVANSSYNTNQINMASRLIAHDVVEHSVKHRTNDYVSYEEEIRALGASMYVRGQNEYTLSEIVNLVSYVQRSIKKVPHIIRNYIDKKFHFFYTYEEFKEKFENNTDTKTTKAFYKKVMYQLSWGYLNKLWQYSGNKSKPWNDFNFLQDVAKQALETLINNHCSGVSVFFDTVLGHYNIRLKHGRY